MLIFATISVLFIPPAVVTAIFGMNVKIPYMVSDECDTLTPFQILLLFSAVWSAAILYLMWKQKMF